MTTTTPAQADWNEIAAIVADALDCASEAERMALIATRCAGRSALHAEVLSLLGHAADSSQLIASGGANQHAEITTSKFIQVLANGGAPSIGSRLNAWKILSELGRGGMGIVFKVEREIYAPAGVSPQLQTRQIGALKLMRIDASSPQALARFAREQKILAQLNHPNISRLIDGGATPEGNPYLVMEYAAGQNLDQWCITTQPDLNMRITVIQKICAAVQYAHQLLIVHRDLKPSNIIIDSDNNPKLLDFGIAKLLGDADASEHTAEAARVYTPWYASPEHLRGEAATTTSDVYSLGVILYGLLTAKRPYKLRNTTSATAVDVMHAVLETEATRPSWANTGNDIEAAWSGSDNAAHAFASALEGDLDNIILKALAKEPARRYATPDALAADLQRYLNDEPVAAASPTARYRAYKFIRRNKVGVSAAGVAVSALIAGAGVAMWQAQEAVKQRNIAEARFKDSREQATTVLFDYLDAVQYLPGSTPIRKRMAEDAQKYLDKLALESVGDSKTNAATLTSVAIALQRLSFVQYNGNARPHIGDRSAAVANVARSLKIIEQLIASGEANEELNFEHGQALMQLGVLLAEKQPIDAGIKHLEKAVSTYTIAAANDRADLRNGIELARSHLRVVNTLFKHYPYPPAEIDASYSAHLKSARAALDAVAAKQANHAELPHVWEWVLRLEAQQFRAKNDWADALAPLLTKLALMQKLAGDAPNNSAYANDLGATYRDLALNYNTTGDHAKALEAAVAAKEIAANAIKNDPASRVSALQYANALLQAAWAEAELASAGDSRASLRVNAAFAQAHAAVDAPLKQNPDDFAGNLLKIEMLRREAEFTAKANPQAALGMAQKAVQLAAALDAKNQAAIELPIRIAFLQNLIATLAIKLRDGALQASTETALAVTLQRVKKAVGIPPHMQAMFKRLNIA